MRLPLSALLIAGLLAGCAARGPAPELVAALGRAEQLVQDGCFRCLEQALAEFERLAAAPRPPLEASRRGLEAALLLAARAREIGVPPESFLARAAALAPAVAKAFPTALPLQTYLDAFALIAGDLTGLDPEQRLQRSRQTPRPDGAPGGSAARAALTPAVATDVVAAYFALAIDCEDARQRQQLKADAVSAAFIDTPAVRYRIALCAIGGEPPRTFRERDPRWVETLLNEGRVHLATRPEADVVKATEAFAAAHREFPTSAAITLALGNAQNMLGDYPAAIASFDTVLAETPTHREALLGKVMSLSYLSRHTDAVSVATQMIDLGNWHVGDAYYWRAWNRYHLYHLDPAWDDIEQAVKLLVNTNVYTLAGTIAYARRQLDTALDRFARAYAMDRSNCEAVWTPGLIHVDQEAWTDAASKFALASGCFDQAATTARAEFARVEASTVAEPVKSRRLGIAQKRIDTAEHRKAQSAFNAAQSYVRVGDKASALEHIEGALAHPLLKEKAEALKAAIAKMR